MTGTRHLNFKSTDTYCKLNSVVYDFYKFFIDKSGFSLRICKYSMGKLMIEVLNMVKKCKIDSN